MRNKNSLKDIGRSLKPFSGAQSYLALRTVTSSRQLLQAFILFYAHIIHSYYNTDEMLQIAECL